MDKKRYKKMAILVVPAVAILAVLVLSTQLTAARGPGRFGVGAGARMYDRPGPGIGPWNAPERGMRARLGQTLRSGSGRDGAGSNILRLVRKLDLTDEQAEKIKETIKTNQEKIQTAQKAVAESRKALNETVAKDADEAAIREAATAVGKALGDAAVLRVNTATSVKAILTEEQRTKLEELRKEIKERPANLPNEAQRPGMRGRFRQQGTPYGRGPMFYSPYRPGAMRRGWMRGPIEQGRGQPWGW
jgi:Spy/CpxP family protein refolding chaperone